MKSCTVIYLGHKGNMLCLGVRPSHHLTPGAQQIPFFCRDIPTSGVSLLIIQQLSVAMISEWWHFPHNFIRLPLHNAPTRTTFAERELAKVSDKEQSSWSHGRSLEWPSQPIAPLTPTRKREWEIKEHLPWLAELQQNHQSCAPTFSQSTIDV